MVGVLGWRVPVYGDTSTDWSNPDPAFHIHDCYPDSNPGANPSNPANYAFLPPDHRKPEFRQRTMVPTAMGTDLAQGLPYTISSEFPDSFWQGEASAAFPDRGQLTNGKFAGLEFSDPQWIGLQYQYQHTVTVHLSDVQNFRAISLDFLQDLGAGIVFPDEVQYLVSQDGKRWAPVGTVKSSTGQGDFTVQTQAFELTNVNVNAAYVRAQFTNKIWAFIDQFAVYGDPIRNPAAQTPVGTISPGQPRGYLSTDNPDVAGPHHMLLAYTDGDAATGTWSENDFAPMVTHPGTGTDTTDSVRGSVKATDGHSGEDTATHPPDWMFDSILFSPYRLPTNSKAWSDWVDDLFTPGRQLYALNDAVGQAKAAEHRADFKENVVITIPLIGSVNRFGIKGLGQEWISAVPLDLNPLDLGQQTAYQNKVRIVAWYIRYVEQMWRRAGLNNLTLAGFYWQPESLQVTQPYDKQLVQTTADLVHRAGLKFYWIPFYGAAGVTEWKELGFDSVMVQPNVSFHWNMPPEPRFRSVTDFAKYYGTGLEIEAHWDVVDNWSGLQAESLATIAQNRYFNYFTAGHVFGYEKNVPLAYYENSKTLVTAFQNPLPFYHRVYDNTAAFMHGQWTDTTFD